MFHSHCKDIHISHSHIYQLREELEGLPNIFNDIHQVDIHQVEGAWESILFLKAFLHT